MVVVANSEILYLYNLGGLRDFGLRWERERDSNYCRDLICRRFVRANKSSVSTWLNRVWFCDFFYREREKIQLRNCMPILSGNLEEVFETITVLLYNRSLLPNKLNEESRFSFSQRNFMFFLEMDLYKKLWFSIERGQLESLSRWICVVSCYESYTMTSKTRWLGWDKKNEIYQNRGYYLL